jgi:hypothetical protein
MRVNAPVDGGANRSPLGDGRRQLAAAVRLGEPLDVVLDESLDDVPDELLEPDFSEDAVDVSEDFSDVEDDVSVDLPFDELLESLR